MTMLSKTAGASAKMGHTDHTTKINSASGTTDTTDTASSDSNPAIDVRLRLRVMQAGLIAIGPGKVSLLEGIRDTGSISAAARALNMSYRRAWLLIEELNTALAQPATTSGPGGKQGGGSTLTPVGSDIIARYRRIEDDARRACQSDINALKALIK